MFIFSLSKIFILIQSVLANSSQRFKEVLKSKIAKRSNQVA